MAVSSYPPLQLTAARIAAAGGLVGQSAVLQADFPKVNNTFSNVTDLTLTLTAGNWYRVTAQLAWSNGLTSGALDFTGGSLTATGVSGSYVVTDLSSLVIEGSSFTSLGELLFSDNDTGTLILLDFTIQVNAGGTMIPRFKQAVTDAGNPVTLNKYSTITA